MSLLEQDITRKRWVNDSNITAQLELNKGNNEWYRVKAICDSEVYTKELDSTHHLLGLYCLVLWKGDLEKENTWEPALAILYLCKLISILYRDYPEKPTATPLLIDSASPTTRSIVSPIKAPSTKQKRDQPTQANGTSKCAKKSTTSNFFWTFLALS